MRNVTQLCLASLAKNDYACAVTNITWSISGKVIGLEVKCPLNVVKMKEEMAVFLCQWQCCGLVASVRDRKLLWSKFLVICVV